MAEKFKTFFLMAILMVLFMICGYLLGGQSGLLIALGFAILTNFVSYFFSDKMVLRHYNAKPVSRQNAKGLYEMVEKLCIRGNLPVPKIYIINEPVPNAFATGRNPQNAAIAVNTGLLDLMSEQEVEGVIAHELSHIRHYDILIQTIAAVFAGAIATIASIAKFGAVLGQGQNNRPNPIIILVAAVIMPLAASVIQMAISRNREFLADEGSARLTGHPEYLISGLSKLENFSRQRVLQNATPQTSHMFIMNPFNGAKSSFLGLFRTHPTTEQRISRLKSIKL